MDQLVTHHHPIPSTDPRLKRYVWHDPRSRYWDADTLIKDVEYPQPVMHEEACPPWDQGEVGCCTADAALGVLMAEPFHKPEWAFTQTNVLDLYKAETRIDDTQFPGHYPEQDTGSSGLWSMKALKARGLISGYRHAFSINTAVRLLVKYPVSTGLPWFNSMFDTDYLGNIVLDESTGLAGGHQVAVVGYDGTRDAVRIRNSWGTSWADQGHAWLRVEDWMRLLALHGDVVVPVL